MDQWTGGRHPNEVAGDRDSGYFNSREIQIERRSLNFIGHLLCAKHSTFPFTGNFTIRLRSGCMSPISRVRKLNLG